MRLLHVVAAVALVAGCDDTDDNHGPPSTPAGLGLVSRTDIVTDATDPTLINAWGLAFNPSAGFAWISANGSGVAEIFDSSGRHVIPNVTIPGPGGMTSAPTGQVFNGNSSNFMGDTFIFVTEDGLIAGWQMSDGTTATTRVDNSGNGAVYKGVTIASDRLFATDFHNGTVDVFDRNFTRMSITFQDSSLPAGFAPFNVANINGQIMVSFALQDAAAHDDVKGVGNGFVDVFDINGNLQRRLISQGELNSPWGMTLTPATFGAAPNRLLVGNFGDGLIHVYNFNGTSATFENTLKNADNTPMVIDGLWALVFGPGTGGFAPDQLFFTAGPNDEMNGVFGRLSTSTVTTPDGGTTGQTGGTTSGQ